ncbi:hypothetical protein BDP81DRAFT_393288 [Colletotrichum phormii]|uniref:Uncharacterized protein n=1 Tax=Colletotrichum phormii TaxID=359342 RepID=A0AAI9ZSU5_9PEZI|nr:uncharacterized protein BDP81DRAFT_393288 [Colletotrichum phormii]KAK1637580.1 hypothetical protein BDP81DRAFT_393288 [Colletotrichum phormii]
MPAQTRRSERAQSAQRQRGEETPFSDLPEPPQVQPAGLGRGSIGREMQQNKRSTAQIEDDEYNEYDEDTNPSSPSPLGQEEILIATHEERLRKRRADLERLRSASAAPAPGVVLSSAEAVDLRNRVSPLTQAVSGALSEQQQSDEFIAPKPPSTSSLPTEAAVTGGSSVFRPLSLPSLSYTGKSARDLQSFLFDCYYRFDLWAQQMKSDRDRVAYAVSCLQGNVKTSWMHYIFDRRRDVGFTMDQITWAELETFLQDNLSDPASRGVAASIRLDSASQGAKEKVDEEATDFYPAKQVTSSTPSHHHVADSTPSHKDGASIAGKTDRTIGFIDG